MKDSEEPKTLEQLLEKIGEASDGKDRVDLGSVVQSIGNRSYAPLLLLAGLMAFSPLSGIPGVPTLVALMVLLISSQMFLKRDHLWLPRWLLDRSVSKGKLDKALRFMKKPARFTDRFLKRRLTWLTRGPGLYPIAVLCILIAVTMPPMEILPFLASAAGAAITAFALSIVVQDGLVTILALVITSVTAFFLVRMFVA